MDRVLEWVEEDQSRIDDLVNALSRSPMKRVRLIRAVAAEVDEQKAATPQEPPAALSRQQRRKEHREYLKTAQKNAGSIPSSKRHTSR